MKITDRTGEMGDPWGVPMSNSSGSERVLFNLSHTFLLSRYDSHHAMISGVKPRSLISWMSLRQLT